MLHRDFLAGDDMKCEAVEEDILATYRAKEEAIIAHKAKAQEVGRGCKDVEVRGGTEAADSRGASADVWVGTAGRSRCGRSQVESRLSTAHVTHLDVRVWPWNQARCYCTSASHSLAMFRELFHLSS